MVYLVGAGPGDPGLVTLKALDILKRADVVLYDRLVDSSLLYETKHGCILIDVGKSAGSHTKTQDETTKLLVDYGRQGLDVVRLKGGDPFLFGRGGEEAERLSRENIPFAVVPGVSALTAAAAYAGIPLTHRDCASSVGIATGHGARGKNADPVRWRELAGGVDTIVVFMGIGTVDSIIDELAQGNLPGNTPVAVIERGSMPSQRVFIETLATLSDSIRKNRISPPALLIIGKTATLHDSLNWYTPGPLAGLRIGITRPFTQSKSFAEKLRALGAQPVPMPAIKTVDTIDTGEIREIIHVLSTYDCVVFSSANGVESFFRALKEYGGDSRSLAGVTVACIGPATAETTLRYGITPEVTAERFVAEGLLESLLDTGSVSGKRFLLVRSNMGRTTLKDGLEREGAIVTEGVFYTTQADILSPYIIKTIQNGDIDIITFTSSSTVEHFFSQIPPDELGTDVKLASIGPQTSRTLRKYGREPDIEASEYTTAGLTESILKTSQK